MQFAEHNLDYDIEWTVTVLKLDFDTEFPSKRKKTAGWSLTLLLWWWNMTLLEVFYILIIWQKRKIEPKAPPGPVHRVKQLWSRSSIRTLSPPAVWNNQIMPTHSTWPKSGLSGPLARFAFQLWVTAGVSAHPISIMALCIQVCVHSVSLTAGLLITLCPPPPDFYLCCRAKH